ncbi:hypothetical protein DFH09DRAFT_1380899, partial [Mycena vulgaris]
ACPPSRCDCRARAGRRTAAGGRTIPLRRAVGVLEVRCRRRRLPLPGPRRSPSASLHAPIVLSLGSATHQQPIPSHRPHGGAGDSSSSFRRESEAGSTGPLARGGSARLTSGIGR